MGQGKLRGSPYHLKISCFINSHCFYSTRVKVRSVSPRVKHNVVSGKFSDSSSRLQPLSPAGGGAGSTQEHTYTFDIESSGTHGLGLLLVPPSLCDFGQVIETPSVSVHFLICRRKRGYHSLAGQLWGSGGRKALGSIPGRGVGWGCIC